MKKVATLVLGLSLIGSMSVAQTVTSQPAPAVVVAGGLAGNGLLLALLPLLLLGALGGGGGTGTAGTTTTTTTTGN